MFGHSGREREKLQPRPEYVQRANNESSYNRRAPEKKKQTSRKRYHFPNALAIVVGSDNTKSLRHRLR